MELDGEKLRSCLSFLNEDGERVIPDKWELPPRSAAVSDKHGCTRGEAVEDWQRLKEASHKFVPFVWQRYQLGMYLSFACPFADPLILELRDARLASRRTSSDSSSDSNDSGRVSKRAHKDGRMGANKRRRIGAYCGTSSIPRR